MAPRDIEESQKAWQRPEAEAERAEARPEGVPSSLGQPPPETLPGPRMPPPTDHLHEGGYDGTLGRPQPGRAPEPTRLEAHAAAARYLGRDREPKALARELDALEAGTGLPLDGRHRALSAARSSEFLLGLRPRPLVSLFVGALVAGVILGRLRGR